MGTDLRFASLILQLLFLLPGLAWASFQGQLQSTTDYYPVNLAPPTENLVPRLGVELEDKEKIKKSLTLSFKGTFESNLVSKYQPEEYFGDIQEAYAEWHSGPTKILVGWNTVNWGSMDIYSPMDVVNQRVYFYPLDPPKRGAPMVNLQWNPSGWAMSAVYIPFQAKALFPSPDSRWLPRQSLLNLESNGETALLPSNPTYNYGADSQMNHALENNYGINIAKRWSSFDVHAIYFNGASPAPTANIQQGPGSYLTSFTPPTTQLEGTTTILPVYYRTQTSALGFSATLGPVILRGESSYTDTISPAGNAPFSSWFWQNGLGLEKNFDFAGTTMTVILQYYYGEYPREQDNLISSHIRMFDNTPAMAIHWALTDDVTIYSMILYEIPQEGLVGVLGYQMKLTDSIHWDISWRELTANKPGLIQTYNDDSHADMKLVYYF